MSLYCTVRRAKTAAGLVSYEDLGLEDADDYTDHVHDVAEMASRFVDNHCGRPEGFFAKGGASITEYHNGKAKRFGADYLESIEDLGIAERRTFYLEHYPVISVSTVKENVAAIGASDDWKTRTKYRVDKKRGIVKFATGVIPQEGFENVEFVYTAGYSSIPVPIAMATAEIAGNYIKDAVEKYTQQHMPWQRPAPLDFSIAKIFTPHAEALLAPYVKRRVG